MEAELKPDARAAIRQALTDLNHDFCYFLDHGLVDDLADLFCEDARYSHGPRISSGREEIKRLFAGRRGAETRTSRHLQSGLRLQIQGPDQAAGQSVCLTFGADARPPVCPATPYLVADFIDHYRRCPDGRWRISSRHIERIFVAADNRGPEGLDK